MDHSELRAMEHLRSRGFMDIHFEPDGNVPPDFLVEARIAVEVRQLNQRVKDGDRGVDETGVPFRQRIDRVLTEFGKSAAGTHWLNLRYRRPLADKKGVVAETRAFAAEVLAGRVPIGTRHPIGANAVLEYVHFGIGPGDAIRVGVTSDQDLGGFVLHELRRSLEKCIDQKSRKTAKFRDRYPEWWLILVDHIAYGLSVRDRDQYFDLPQIHHDWNRVVIVNPLDIQDYFELAGPT